MVRSLTISNSRAPPGVVTLTMSPASLFRNARPIGDVVEMSPLVGVRVLGHDELEDERLAVALDDVHGRAEAGAVVRDAVDVDQRDLRHALLEHADARLDEPLPLLRGLVLGVLAQVAQLARALDLLGQLELQLAVERVDLVLELLDQSLFHR